MEILNILLILLAIPVAIMLFIAILLGLRLLGGVGWLVLVIVVVLILLFLAVRNIEYEQFKKSVIEPTKSFLKIGEKKEISFKKPPPVEERWDYIFPIKAGDNWVRFNLPKTPRRYYFRCDCSGSGSVRTEHFGPFVCGPGVMEQTVAHTGWLEFKSNTPEPIMVLVKVRYMR